MRKFEGFQKGVNLGGWISQFDRYDKAHFDSFIVEADIRDIAGLGFDHVRVPVDYVLFEAEDGTPREDGFWYLELCRAWCEKYGLNLLIDLHECYGYSFDPLKKDMDRERFFYDTALQERFMNLWKRIATRFQDYPQQVAFEPLNEVVLQKVADAWNKVASEWIRMMREIVPDSWLVVGGVCYSSVISVPLLDLPMDPKVVYNFHCYEPMIFTHQGAYWVENMPLDFRIGYPQKLEVYQEKDRTIQLSDELAGAVFKEHISEPGPGFFEDIFAPAIQKAEQDDAPLYCGEYGVIELADSQDALRWLKDIHTVMNRHGIGRALWNYKEKDFGFVGEKFAGIRDEFIKVL